MHDRNDDSDENRHDEDRFAARSEPDNDEGTERDFRERVDDDDIGFEHLSQRFAPPKEQSDPNPQNNRDRKTCKRLP